MAPLVPYLLVAIVGDMVGLIALGVSAQLDRWSASDVGTSANLARARATNRLLSEGKGTALDIAIDKDQERKSDKLETRAKRVNVISVITGVVSLVALLVAFSVLALGIWHVTGAVLGTDKRPPPIAAPKIPPTSPARTAPPP